MSSSEQAAQLREMFHYDPQTGEFTRKVTTASRARAGDVAGNIHAPSGYWVIRALGHQYKAHRLAWLYMTGAWPAHTIDHIDGDRQNNRWSNLRDVPRAINYQNKRSARSNSKTGLLGVAICNGRYQAKIAKDKKTFYLGCYGTPEEAHAAYVQAKRELHEGNTL